MIPNPFLIILHPVPGNLKHCVLWFLIGVSVIDINVFFISNFIEWTHITPNQLFLWLHTIVPLTPQWSERDYVSSSKWYHKSHLLPIVPYSRSFIPLFAWTYWMERNILSKVYLISYWYQCFHWFIIIELREITSFLIYCCPDIAYHCSIDSQLNWTRLW
jgi:hypothetical protein